MNIASEIRNWKGKPKDLVVFLSQKASEDQALVSQVIELLKSGGKVERGIAADVVEELSKIKPEAVIPHIGAVINNIDDPLPKVKWGTQEAIGNLSQKYPEKVEAAIPKLLQNTKDNSTVVRWCAAFALTEVAKNSPSTRSTLVPKIQELASSEGNNGVRNVYLKALKKLR